MRLPHCSIAPVHLTGKPRLGYIHPRNEDDSGRGPERYRRLKMLLWGNLVRVYKRWRAYERTYEELMRLDDRELADINVRRSDIDFIARQSATTIH